MTQIQIEAADGTTEAWLSRPDDQTHPGVLLFIDAIGLRPEIGKIADRIASWGYTVLAPNVFYRSGTAEELAPPGDLTEPGAREAFFGTVGERMQALTTDRIVADIDTYLTTLRALEGVADGPFGVTGYCLGARLAVRAAGLHPDEVAAVGGFHGGNLVTDADDSPHLGLAHARAAFVFGHADNDGSMPPEAVVALGEALTAAGLENTNAIYPGSPHGYTMSDTSMYDATGAERHFSELQALLAAQL
ncbi:MAG TPA: dienelactone hydrolase family protein [Marmoricola sp.]|jgi:carboxymethylenebutenolidase|nr:dienelactone hydrolase family protein [Marmoricola sp.]